MTIRIAAIFAAAALASPQAPPGTGGDIPVTSAVLRLERRAIDGTTIHVENLHDQALETFMIRVGSHWLSHDYSRHPGSYGPGHGPIQSREVRAIKLDGAPPPASSAPAVPLAVFEGAWVEGAKAEMDAWDVVRKLRVDDATFWLDVLNQVKSKTDTEAKEVLRRAVVLRRQQAAEGRNVSQGQSTFGSSFDPGEIAGRVGMAVDDRYPRSSEELTNLLARLTNDLGDLRARMRRPLFRAPVAPGRADPDVARSVSVRVMNEPRTEVFATIENLRDVSIEAYAIDLFDSPLQLKPSTSGGEDLGGVDPANHIQPRATRTRSLGEQPITPSGKIAYVFYSDLLFEGSQERRVQFFRDREQRADDYAYWIGVLDEVRAKPPADVRGFLELRQRERIASVSRDGYAIALDTMQLIGRAEKYPDTFAQNVDATRARMERMRQSLIRHLKR